MHPKVTRAVSHVTLLDAHHDSGYKSLPDTLTGIGRNGYSCEDWMLRFASAERQVVYPDWRKSIDCENGEPLLPVTRMLWSNFDPQERVYDRVFVCRSGAWTPPWLDEHFISFISDFPKRYTSLDPIEWKYAAMLPREFSLERVKEHIRIFEEMKV